MPEFFTRGGDDGFTGLLGDERVPKHHAVPEALGAIDEATAALGVARQACQADSTRQLLLSIQRDLYKMMGEISATPQNAARFRQIDAGRIAWLESQIETAGQEVSVPKEFIVPGDSPAGAALAVARTIVRRAERRVAQLIHMGRVENEELLRYLNRLSSLCFVLELGENKLAGHGAPTLAKGE